MSSEGSDRRDWPTASTARSWEAEIALRLLDEATADQQAMRALVASLRRRVERLEAALVVVAAVALVALLAALA
jgi:hypothetical protein